jgi:hypothetical protein
LGYATLDLDEWRDKLVFGTWVDRPLNSVQVDALLKGFEEHGLQAFKLESQIPLVIPHTSLANLNSLWPALKDQERPPIVQFTPGTQALAAAGGQHRMAALAKYHAIKTRALARAQRSDTYADDSEAAAVVKRVEQQLVECRYWGVALYDEGKSQ